MNYIICKEKSKPDFIKLGFSNFCTLKDMDLNESISIDTETTSLKPILGDIFCIQIGNGKGSNYLIKCYEKEFTPNQVFPFIKDKTWVGQNLTFDLTFFYKYGLYPEKVKDCMIASKLLYNGLKEYRHDFKTIFERELDVIYDKSEQKNISNIKLSTFRAIDYCFQDVDRLLELHNFLEKKIINEGYWETYKLHCEYIKSLAYMETSGVPISESKWKNKIELDLIVLEEKEKVIKDYIINFLPQFHQTQLDLFSNDIKINIDLGSPKQMIPVFNALNINTKDDDFNDSISENVIKKTKHPFVDIWLEFQSAKHDVTTFGKNIFDKVINGRIYSSFNPILDTARISTRKGDVNTLNLPANKRTRECIEAKPGYKIIVSDYDGQETRVGGSITEDKVMINSIIDGLDLHCAFARVLYPELTELSDDEIIKNHKSKRNASKSPRFCFQFGGTGYTLALNENLPIEEGIRIEKLFKELHSGIYEWGDKKLEEVLKIGYIESAMGFKLHLPQFKWFKELEEKIKMISKTEWTFYREGKIEFNKQKKAIEDKKPYIILNKTAYDYYKSKKSDVSKFFKLKSQYYRLVLNNPTQTTAAHQTKQAACDLFDFIKKNNHIEKAKICIIPHDEFVLEVEENLASLYKENLGRIIREAGNKFITHPLIKMEAEANIGNNWYSAK